MNKDIIYPKISVITPSYNQGKFLERTIQSILNQNYPNLEYIICDGGSTDESIDIIKKYSDKITWWCSEPDGGQTYAINKGMRKATGDIVCWINSDDVLLPNALQHVGKFFSANPNIDFIMGIVLEIDKNDFIIKMTHTILNKNLAQHGCYNINQQGMFWKRSLFNTIGYLQDDFHACMDAEFVIRLLENNIPIKVLNHPLGAIRIHNDTKTAQGGIIWENDWKKISQHYNGKYVRNKKSIYYLLYGFLKFVKLYYFKDIFFKLSNKNKKFFEL